MEAEDDLFQKLPDELLTKVTTFLLLEDAARTSILSRRWRYAWRKSPNPHFDCNKITKFTSNAYPISCFESIHHFFGWMDKIVAKQCEDTDLCIESLGLNFNTDTEQEEEENNRYGWIELRRSSDESVVIGSKRVVSFLSNCLPIEGMIGSLTDLLSRRRNLLIRRLTLQNCDTETLERQIFSGGCYGDSFRSLESLAMQCGGKWMELRLVSRLIESVPSLKDVTLEDCKLDVGDGISVKGSNIKLNFVRCILH